MKRTVQTTRFAALLALLVLSCPRSALAQRTEPKPQADAPKPPAPPVLVPPQVETDPGAAYPVQAITDKVKDSVSVVLVVDVDTTGAVKDVKVETAQGHGFDEAAIEAGQKLTFKPATRDGTPIASRTKHTYVFPPPSARLVGKVSTQSRETAVGGARVIVLDPTGASRETTTAEDGSFEITGIASGAYKITIEAKGFTSQMQEETLDPGSETRLETRLERVGGNALPPPPKDPDVQDVEVRGTKPPREVTKRTLEQREISRIPGTNGDGLRAIQNLPGVARPPGLAGLLIVRGSAPNETSVFVDGTLVPLVYHFGGLSSVIPTELLDKIDFYPGNFSSYYGRVTGGVVDVGVHDPRPKKDGGPHALIQADLIDVRGLVEGEIGHSGWTYALAGRRSYVDLWLKPALEQAGSGVTTAPVYYDYQAMLHKTWGNGKHDFRLFFFGSDDRLEILLKSVNASNPGVGGNITFGTAFYRLQARYTGKLSDKTEVRLTAAVGKDSINFSLGDNLLTIESYPINPRFEISQKLAAGVRNNLGVDILYTPYDVQVRLPPPPRPGEPPGGPFGGRPPLEVNEKDATYRPAMYDELELTPFRGTRIIPGVRVDYAKDTRSWDVQPRLAVRQELTHEFPKTTLKGGIGRFTQPPQPQETNSVFGTPGVRSNIANHYGFGVEREITTQIEASLEGFYRQYDQLIVQRLGNVGEGRAYGLETLIRYKPDDKFFGFIAYTLSRSVRRDAPTDPERLFQYDQTHILTAVGSYRLGRGWEIGARFRLTSGSLRTPEQYGFYDLNVGAYLPLTSYPPYSERLPLFHQLDLRIDKTWVTSSGARISTYLDIYNAYNQGNVEGVNYNYNSTLSTNTTGLPFLPSIGLRLEN